MCVSKIDYQQRDNWFVSRLNTFSNIYVLGHILWLCADSYGFLWDGFFCVWVIIVWVDVVGIGPYGWVYKDQPFAFSRHSMFVFHIVYNKAHCVIQQIPRMKRTTTELAVVLGCFVEKGCHNCHKHDGYRVWALKNKHLRYVYVVSRICRQTQPTTYFLLQKYSHDTNKKKIIFIMDVCYDMINWLLLLTDKFCRC